MRSIRIIAVLAGTATVLISGAFAAPLAGSQTPLGHMTEEEIMMLNSGAESEWRLPGGGTDCGSTCPAGMKCCGGGGMPIEM
jgi:hypothetical protein